MASWEKTGDLPFSRVGFVHLPLNKMASPICPPQPLWLRPFALRTIWTQIQLDFEPNISRLLILPLPLKRYPFLLLSRCSLSLVSDPNAAAASPGSPEHGPPAQPERRPQPRPARRRSTPLLPAGAALPRRAAPCSRPAGAPGPRRAAPAPNCALPRPPPDHALQPPFDGQRAASPPCGDAPVGAGRCWGRRSGRGRARCRVPRLGTP